MRIKHTGFQKPADATDVDTNDKTKRGRMKLQIYRDPLLAAQQTADSEEQARLKARKKRERTQANERNRRKRAEKLRLTPLRVQIYAAAHHYVSLVAAEKAMLRELEEQK
jgi:hypothetical protein